MKTPEKLVVVPIEEPELTLEILVEQITPMNRHEEIETGAPLGAEVW